MRRLVPVLLALGLALSQSATHATSPDRIYFSSVTNVTDLLQQISAETVPLDISSWHLSEHAISIAIANRFHAGVKVRVIGHDQIGPSRAQYLSAAPGPVANDTTIVAML